MISSPVVAFSSARTEYSWLGLLPLPEVVGSFLMTSFPWVPLAGLLLLFAGVVGLRFTRPVVRLGHCPACGYDMRATPARCPECGRVRY